MAKISFLQKPTFKATVAFPQFGGKPVDVPFVFNFLDRDKMSAMADAESEYNKAVRDLIEGDGSKVVEISGRAKEHQLSMLSQIVVGWGFEEEFSPENLEALVNHSAEGAAAILSAFHGTYNKAREGNSLK